MTAGDSAFGIISELNPKLLRDIGVDFNELRVAVFDIDLELLLGIVQSAESSKKYKKLPKYPEVSLALAVVVDESVSVREVYDFILSQEFEIQGVSSRLMEQVELFDVYRGKPLEEHTKNLAFNLFYRRNDRTLTEKEANIVHEELARRIRDNGWGLR
jgi:phenylalanyl-tRNA synthetase beta chain